MSKRRGRNGKIASFPYHIRKEVNERLRDGESGPIIIDWLHSEADVIAVIESRWKGQLVTDQNLSEWRNGGYQDWLNQQHGIERLAQLSERARETVGSAPVGGFTDAARVMLSGTLLELITKAVDAIADDENDESEIEIFAFIETLSALSKADSDSRAVATGEKRAELNEKQIALRESELEFTREKFELNTVTQFKKWAGTDEAAAILNSDAPEEVQMDQLRALLFGEPDEAADDRDDEKGSRRGAENAEAK
jgi:hypothetical protein